MLQNNDFLLVCFRQAHISLHLLNNAINTCSYLDNRFFSHMEKDVFLSIVWNMCLYTCVCALGLIVMSKQSCSGENVKYSMPMIQMSPLPLMWWPGTNVLTFTVTLSPQWVCQNKTRPESIWTESSQNYTNVYSLA